MTDLQPLPGCRTCELHREATQTEAVKRSWAKHIAAEHSPVPEWVRKARARDLPAKVYGR